VEREKLYGVFSHDNNYLMIRLKTNETGEKLRECKENTQNLQKNIFFFSFPTGKVTSSVLLSKKGMKLSVRQNATSKSSEMPKH
jgi:hypothetical protein